MNGQDLALIASLDLEVLALLATFAIHSTLLLGAAWLFARSTQAPRLRELVWKGALVGALATTMLQTQVAGGPLALNFTISPGAAPTGLQRSVSTSNNMGEVLGREVPAGLASGASSSVELRPMEDAVTAEPAEGPASREPSPSGHSQVTAVERLAHGVVLTWLLAVALGALNILRQHRKLCLALAGRSRLKGGPLVAALRGLAPGVALYQSGRISSPLVLSRRAICVPSYALVELDESSQLAMLAHEVEHVERRDGAWLLFAVALQVAFPFQPLIRLAITHMRQDAELLCDAGAIGRTGDGLALARCLATVAERHVRPALPAWSAAMASKPSELVQRVESALARPAAPLAKLRVATTALLGFAALAVLACTGPRATTTRTANAAETSPVLDTPLIEAALRQAAQTPSELTLQIQVTRPGTRYHTGLNGTAPTIPFTAGHKGPSAWVGRETECIVAGVHFASDEVGLASLAELLRRLAAPDPERKVTIQPMQGVVYADIIPVLDRSIEAGFVDIGFKGSDEERPAARAPLSSKEERALRQLGYVAAETPGPDGPMAQTGLDEATVEQLQSLGYSAEAPKFAADALPPEPAFIIHVDGNGTISIDSMLVVHGDSDDLEPLHVELVKRAKVLKQRPSVEGSSSMVVDEPVLISMGKDTPFGRVLQVYELFGRPDVAILGAQFGFGRTLPVPASLIRMTAPTDGHASAESAPVIKLFASTGGIKLETPDMEVEEATHEELQSGRTSGLSRALAGAAKRWPGAKITVFTQGAVTASPIEALLGLMRREGLASRVRFAAYRP